MTKLGIEAQIIIEGALKILPARSKSSLTNIKGWETHFKFYACTFSIIPRVF